MSVIGSNILAGASGQAGYFLTKSLRFRSSASARLTRTPASASNRRTYTISAWVKLGSNASSDVGTIFCGGDSSTSTSTHMYFYLNCLRFYFGGAGGPEWITSQVFRDYSSWYHIVAAVDTTQATFGNRLKLYINGTEVTSWSAQGTGGNTALNSDTQINNSVGHGIGSNGAAAQYLYDGYMAEFNFIDGLQLTPSYFGETSTSTGVWIPKKYTGTYGTNGFYLDFEDTSSTAALGYDAAGSNDWTVSGISLTAGVTYDSMNDVPTLTSATTANYAVWSPLVLFPNTTYQATMSNANMLMTRSAGGQGGAVTTIGTTSGKFYAEMPVTAVGSSITKLGVVSSNNPPSMNSGSEYDLGGTSVPASIAYRSNGARLTNGTTTNSWGSTYTTGDVIGVAFDADTGKIWFAKNNTWQASGDPAAGTNPAVTLATGEPFYFSAGGESGISISLNCGQQPFTYTPPSGFVALNTFNLPTPTIGATASSQANKYMNISLYTGTGSSQSITGLGFQPDWTWIKGRSGATDHGFYDAVRGVQKQLESNNTDAETTETTGLTAFGSDGFTVGALAQLNTSSATYVAWNWRASNATAVTNTDGTITSTVSASTTAGFSVVTYTGTGANATVGHGLGVAPSMVIVKARSTTGNWCIWHTKLTSGAYALFFNTDAQDNYPTIWNSTIPTSTVFSIGTASGTNVNGQTQVAYCFAQIAGYSAFGSYTGNGSTDGPFVYTGFRPRFVLVKESSAAGNNWVIYDTARDAYNECSKILYPNASNAEFDGSTVNLDILSNGFKPRDNWGGNNNSGNTYIYMAFAENPFKYANAR